MHLIVHSTNQVRKTMELHTCSTTERNYKKEKKSNNTNNTISTVQIQAPITKINLIEN